MKSFYSQILVKTIQIKLLRHSANALTERFFRTVGEMSRCQMLQFNCEEELWQDSRSHAVWLLNRVPTSKYVPDQRWLTPWQQQFPDQKLTDLTKLQPFGITCWTHIKNARRPGKNDFNPRGEQGRLVGYDDDQGSLLARIYIPQTGIFNYMITLIFAFRVITTR